MKTSITQENFLKNTSNRALAANVLARLDDFKEVVENVNNYRDARNGITGFIYYEETHAFSTANQGAIIEALEYDAEEQGTDIIDMVKNFGQFGGKMDEEERKDLYRFLGGCEVNQGTVTNVMAWYALERTIYELSNFIEE